MNWSLFFSFKFDIKILKDYKEDIKMSKKEKINLVELSRRVEKDIETLEDLKDAISDLPTEDLIGSYEDINDTKKMINKFRDVIRDEIAENRVLEDSDYISTDEEGNRFLEANDRIIKAVRRESAKLKKDKAEELLISKGLYENTVDRKVKGDVKVIDILMDIKEEVESFAVKDKIDAIVYRMLEVEEKISEKKLENLKDMNFISDDEYDELYSKSITYALYPIKDKKKLNS
jgi:hypothetical protein